HSPTRSLLYGRATVSLRRGLLSDAGRTGAVRAMARMLKSMRLLGGSTAILLFLGLLGLVMLNEVPPLVLLLTVGPALLWMTTWIWEGRPPKGWSVKDPARSDQANQRLRKWARRDLIL